MSFKKNINKKDNKSFGNFKGNIVNSSSTEIWSSAYLIDNIFNDLIDKSIEDKNGKKINKYIYQAIVKFHDFRRKSPVTFFDIRKDDLSNETKKHLNNYVKDCNSGSRIYEKLNGIMTEVIARITKQAEPLILSSVKEKEDAILLKTSINQIRESVSFRWGFVEK